jgi:hypothetical protein
MTGGVRPGWRTRSETNIAELSALYFSRALLECFAGKPLVAELDSDPFKHSLGVYRGPATKVQLRFHPQIATSIKERTWHASQRFKDRADGSMTMTLEVSDDYALRSWLLGFGRYVRVLAPTDLGDWIQEELYQARQQYADGDRMLVADSDIQPGLPFLFNRLVNA